MKTLWIRAVLGFVAVVACFLAIDFAVAYPPRNWRQLPEDRSRAEIITLVGKPDESPIPRIMVWRKRALLFRTTMMILLRDPKSELESTRIFIMSEALGMTFFIRQS